MNRPKILLFPLEDIKLNRIWMLPDYMTCLTDAGALPVIAPPTNDIRAIRQLAESFDGFLFPGGQDVPPQLYHETPLPVCGPAAPRRDMMEPLLQREVLALGKPILGICRGMQLLNVVLGGTLYQDLPSQRPSALTHKQTPPYHIPAHKVLLAKEAPLRSLAGAEILDVNSRHHQAAKDLAPSLRPMAWAEDGLVEAFYAPERRFVWGVQWHPEQMHDRFSAELFRAFVSAAGD